MRNIQYLAELATLRSVVGEFEMNADPKRESYQDEYDRVGIGIDIRHRIEAVVAGPVRDGDGVIVEHPREAGRVAPRTHIRALPRPG
jgi:hypothetical protein